MYFFILSLLFQYYSCVLTLNYTPKLGKYQIETVPTSNTCEYENFMSSTSKEYTSGIDHRYPYIENDTMFVYKFNETLQKHNLLKVLQNENESLHNKQTFLDEFNKNYSDHSSYGVDIFAGGLLNDWDANMQIME